jgi:hypothetical protein
MSSWAAICVLGEDGHPNPAIVGKGEVACVRVFGEVLLQIGKGLKPTDLLTMPRRRDPVGSWWRPEGELLPATLVIGGRCNGIGAEEILDVPGSRLEVRHHASSL